MNAVPSLLAEKRNMNKSAFTASNPTITIGAISKTWRNIAAVITVVLGLTMPATVPVARAQGNPNPVVVPPTPPVLRLLYNELSAKWWQWLLSIPAPVNPNEDSTGANCAQGQSGPVWFLAGTFGDIPTPVKRTCAVPPGKVLFVPILNTIFGAAAGDCDPSNPGVPCNVSQLRAGAKMAIDNPMLLEVSIDGVSISNLSNYRVQSPAFNITLPEDDVLTKLGIPHLHSGTFGPHVSDGFWVLIAPLSKGKHVIHCKAVANNGFLVEVTNNLITGRDDDHDEK